MVKKVICFILLIKFISHSISQICQIRTSRYRLKDVCCPDYEKRENDCMACSKGYTSYIGQNCKPCSKNTYGERCRFECSCLDFQVCDNVDGCVKISSTTGISVYATSACPIGYTSQIGQNCRPCPKNTYGERCRYDCSCAGFEICDNVEGCIEFLPTTDYLVYATSYDKTYKWTINTRADSGNAITSSHYEANTKGKITDCSVQGLLSREIIVYSAISVLVIGFGICLCFVFFKFKPLTKKNIVTINQTHNSSIPEQIQNIELADRLYEIINEEDILDDRRIQQMQMEMSSNYLDVIQYSNTRESCESKGFENNDNPCQLLSTDQTENLENNLKVHGRSFMSGDSTSSSDEYHQDSTQYYLNPMIDISPPEEGTYLTIATANNATKNL